MYSMDKKKKKKKKKEQVQPCVHPADISTITWGPNWQHVSVREGTGDSEGGPIYSATQHFHID